MNREVTMSNMTDTLIMLLSTDWFLPYWAEIGINIDEAKKVSVQLGCREIVAQILGGCSDYYRSNISPDRQQETASLFLVLLHKLNSEPEVLETHKEWAEMPKVRLNTSFMYWNHTVALAQGRVQESGLTLSASIKAEVAKALEEYQMDEPGFPDICQKSESTWDVYINTLLTSPKRLGSILNSMLRERSFRSFWNHLGEHLTPQQLQELAAWYRAMTVNKLHEDRPDLVPSYME